MRITESVLAAAPIFVLGSNSLVAGHVYRNEGPTQPTANLTGVLPCDVLLEAGFSDRLLLPGSDGYIQSIKSYWALNARQNPWCIIQPYSTEEVSKIVIALNGAWETGAGDWNIAVRSGGHSVGGQSNTDRGVTIDLSMMNSSTYDRDSNLAGIQPGARWKNVYADLLKQGVTATGGRDGDVGVGGFFLGGGNTFFMGRRGFACDSISNYEVVLGNGSVINANESANADLWKALRGGGPNYGLVTRYDVDPLPAKNISYSAQVVTMEHADALLDGMAEFTDLPEQEASHDALFLTFSTDFNDGPMLGLAVKVNSDNIARSPSFRSLDAIPSIENPTISMSMAEAAEQSQLPANLTSLPWTLMFKNDPQILREALKLYEDFTEEMQFRFGSMYFSTRIVFQPMASYFGDISNRRGGNVIGFDRFQGNSVLWVMSAVMNDGVADGAEAIVHDRLAKLVADTNAVAKKHDDGARDFAYFNYADSAQNPLGGYGADNVQLMKRVAKSYDPEGVFQTRVSGGFKIDKVR